MSEVTHLDLDVMFRRSGAGYEAQVLRSPAGDGQSVTFARPFTDLELENFVLKIGRFRARTRRVEAPPVVAAKQVGERLFDAVFAGPVGECLRRSADRAREQQTTLRIRLRLTDCPDLADLPWELLYDRRDDWFLALSGHTPVIRYVQLPDQPRAIQIDLPLRILVIKSEPADCPPLDLAAEWEQVAEALLQLRDAGLVAFTELTSPTLGELRRALLNDTFHVLHYMGHGAFDQQNGGTLLFADRAGRSVPVTGGDLGVMLRDHTSMRLAVLNACEAGRTDPADPFAGVADTLVRRGIPAVVAMQFEVTDNAAVEFAPALYGALAVGRPVDMAVAEARKAMYTVSPIEWATPVLYLRADNARLFDIAGHTPTATAQADHLAAPIRGSGVTVPAAERQPDERAHSTSVARGDSATQGKPQPTMARVPNDAAGLDSRVTTIPQSRSESPWNIRPDLQRGTPRGLIAMWGAPASGKTTFLATLNIALQRMDGNWSMVAADAASEAALTKLAADLTGKGAFPEATVLPEEYRWMLQGQVPVTVRKRFRKEQRPNQLQILIDCVDVPDETTGSGQERLVETLLRSSGILYMFDPIREFEAGDAYERVTGICNQLRRQMMDSRLDDGGLPHSLAVCVTKFDEPSVLNQARELNLLTVDPFDSYAFPRVQDDDAREFFRHLCHASAGRSADMLITALERCFRPERIKYFVASSVGFYTDPHSRIFNPDDSQNVMRSGEPSQHVRIRGSIHPINVAEPLLWLTRQSIEHGYAHGR